MTTPNPPTTVVRATTGRGAASIAAGPPSESANSLKENQESRFHGYVVDRLRWSLRWQDTPIAVSRKSFDLLVYLIDHRDHVSSKDALMKALWPKQIVEESNLSQHVFLLRKALSRHPSAEKIIETITGRGYRFAAPLDAPEQPPSGRPEDLRDPVSETTQAANEALDAEAPTMPAQRDVAAQSIGITRVRWVRRAAGIPVAAAIFALGMSAGYHWQNPRVPRAQEADVSQFDGMKVTMRRSGPAEAPPITSELNRCYTAQRTLANGAMLAAGMAEDR